MSRRPLTREPRTGFPDRMQLAPTGIHSGHLEALALRRFLPSCARRACWTTARHCLPRAMSTGRRRLVRRPRLPLPRRRCDSAYSSAVHRTGTMCPRPCPRAGFHGRRDVLAQASRHSRAAVRVAANEPGRCQLLLPSLRLPVVGQQTAPGSRVLPETAQAGVVTVDRRRIAARLDSVTSALLGPRRSLGDGRLLLWVAALPGADSARGGPHAPQLRR